MRAGTGGREYVWRKVERRKLRSRRSSQMVGESRRGSGTSFFFRNFPEYCSAASLWRTFCGIGEVGDVFIPGKRDIKGKRFGFVRFLGVSNMEEVLERLNQTWIDSYLLRAYLPKFSRPAGGRKEVRPPVTNVNEIPKTGLRSFNDAVRVEGRRFSDVVVGEKGRGRTGAEGGEPEVVEEEVIVFQSSGENVDWLAGAFTGQVKKNFSWKDYGDEIQNECFRKLNLVSLGGNLVLIRSHSNESVKEILKGFEEWLSFWWEWWRPWEPTDVNKRREVWTKWGGVPLQAWTGGFFELGSAKIGSYIKMHERTINKSKLDEAFILVATGLQFINRTFSCWINGMMFQIRIEECRT